jgi:hypothetical protein
MMASSNHVAAFPKRAAAGFAHVMSPLLFFKQGNQGGEERPRSTTYRNRASMGVRMPDQSVNSLECLRASGEAYPMNVAAAAQ